MDRRFTPYQQRKTAKKAPKSVTQNHVPVNWTPDEDEVLRRAVFKHGGKKWKTIATFLQHKTPSQCNQRWNELQNHGSAVKKPWSPSEDMRMIDLVKTHGAGKWAVIASYLPGRNGKQCRERWHNQLNPAIKKGPWTVEEDAIIMDMQSKYGNRWAKITEKLPGRTDNAVKNHWHSSMKAKVKRSNSDASSCGPETTTPASSAPGEDGVVKDEDEPINALPVTPKVVQSFEVKLESGSLSPDSVAMCPSRLEPSFRCDHSVFFLDEVADHDESSRFALPPPLVRTRFSLGRDQDLDEREDDEDDLDSVLDGIEHEELVLSTDVDEEAMDLERTSRASQAAFDSGDVASVGALFDDSAEWEPSRHDEADPLAPLRHLDMDVLTVEVLQALDDVAYDDVAFPETEPVKSEPKTSPTPLWMIPTTGLVLPEWSAPTLTSPALLSPEPEPIDAPVYAPPLAPPSPMDAPFLSPLSVADPTLTTWLNGQPYARHDPENDAGRIVWDLM